MSRTGIFVTTPAGSCTISEPSGHIQFEPDDGQSQIRVPGGATDYLVASMGDPSSFSDNTGTLRVAAGNHSFVVDLRKRTGKDMQMLSVDPTQPALISFTNDFTKHDEDHMKRTSITIHVQSPPD